MKFVVALAALMSALSFSSCLDDDDDNSSSWDLAAFVTVKETLGTVYLLTDKGMTLIPTSTSVISGLLNGSSYYPRAYGYFKFADDEVYSDSQTSYYITNIVSGMVLNSADFNESPDTLTADYAISSLTSSAFPDMWAKNGYINVPFTTAVSSDISSVVDAFHLYVTGVSEDTLCTRFQQDAWGENAYNTYTSLVSYKLPFGDAHYYQLTPKQDSIVIKVVANGGNNSTIVKTTKYKYAER